MSEPIIIETPQPPVREHAVLVRDEDITEVRDAPGFPARLGLRLGAPIRRLTPEDLERAGWVPRSALDGPLDLSAAPRTTAGVVEEIRAEWTARQTTEARLERERDEARAEALSLREQREDHHRCDAQIRRTLAPLLGLGETEECAEVMVTRIVIAYHARASERDEARAALAATTRQRDDATALASRLRCDLDRATDREDGVAHERERCVEWLRRRPGPWPFGTSPNDVLRTVSDAIERGDHAGTPVPERATERPPCNVPGCAARIRWTVLGPGPSWVHYCDEHRPPREAPVPALPRAADEELVTAYHAAFCDVSAPQEEPHEVAHARGIAAVAARVRREQYRAYYDALCLAHEAQVADLSRVRAEDPTNAELVTAIGRAAYSADGYDVRDLQAAYRLGRGERPATGRDQPRATDEELYRVYMASPPVMDTITESTQTAIRAVAARVRAEQCLVARAVEAGVDMAIVEDHDDAERPGLWYIVRITESGGEETEATVPAADVPATLARLLDEAAR